MMQPVQDYNPAKSRRLGIDLIFQLITLDFVFLIITLRKALQLFDSVVCPQSADVITGIDCTIASLVYAVAVYLRDVLYANKMNSCVDNLNTQKN